MRAAAIIANVILVRVAAILVVIGAVVASQDVARAQTALRGVALVIGNGEYEHLPALANPPGDARAIDDLLDGLGFETTISTDRDARRLERDLEFFLEDAEGADVAIVFYAGHGIEAGGENFLVPVDADLAALDAAGEKLVPVSAFLERLRSTVPVAIVLLDACRDNPFPAGAQVTLEPGGSPVPIGSEGLGETRGAARLVENDPGVESFGTVIAFAAAPGHAALDGAPGGNSPYTTAILRHLDAMAGQEFGLVMRMVAEEVYLRTDGAQRPWINESLRRLLYFGAAPEPLSGDEGAILSERRQLLLTIADLPDAHRARAENLAASGGVPMSVVYAMLRALGVDPNDDPQRVEARLRAEIEAYARLRAARDALENPDAEIRRLTELADRAEEEGALQAADGFREQAKRRVDELRGSRQEQIDLLRDRIREDAEVYVRSAETKKLMFRHREAAADYGEASDMLAQWDAPLSADLRHRQVAALLVDAELRGTASSLDDAERFARAAIATGTAIPESTAARLRHALAVALMQRSFRDGTAEPLEEALEWLRSIERLDGDLTAVERARIAIDTGRALAQTGVLKSDSAMMLEAEAYFSRAAALAVEAKDVALAAEAHFRRVQSLYLRWTVAQDPALMTAFMAEITTLSTLLDAGDQDEYSVRFLVRSTHIALDFALRVNTIEALQIASDIQGASASIFDRERFPLLRAELDLVAARVAYEAAERFGDFSNLLNALDLQRAALAVFEAAGASALVSDTRWQHALTLLAVATREPATERLDEAQAVLAAMAATERVQQNPVQRAAVAFQQARARAVAAIRRGDVETLRQAVEDLSGSIEAVPEADIVTRTTIRAETGKAASALAMMVETVELYRKAVAWLEPAIDQHEQWGSRRTNPWPFVELFSPWSDTLTALAAESEEPRDIARAIETGLDLRGQFKALGVDGGVASTSNGVAYMMALQLRSTFDEELYRTARGYVDEAMRLIETTPHYIGYFQNTTCELDTEKARHDRDLEAARAALLLCEQALRSMKEYGQDGAIETVEASIARAGALVAELER